MTSIFCCGFECGVAGSAGQHWGSISRGSIQSTIKRTGARSLQLNPSANNCGVQSTVSSALPSIYVVRFYIYFTTLPNANCCLFRSGAGADQNGVYFKSSDSKIYAGHFDGGVSVTFGATGVDVSVNRWYRIDAKIITTASPATIDVKVDGIDCSQLSNTGESGTSNVIAFGSGSFTITADFCVDDLVVSNTSADYPIGNGYVSHFVPTSDGTHNVAGANDFERSATGTDIDNTTTTAFQLIDDVPLKSGVVAEYINLIAPPNASDYVEVIFGPAPGIPTPTYGPRAVEAICALASASAGTNNIRLALNDNGTTDDIFNSNGAVGTTANYTHKHYSDPPSAATVWGIASGNGNFNNVRLRCLTSDAAPDPWLASAMIEAEFAEPKQKVVHINQSVNRSNTY